MRYLSVIALFMVMFAAMPAFAQEPEAATEGVCATLDGCANAALGGIVHYMDAVLFYPLNPAGIFGDNEGDGMPALVLWLISGGIYFTFRLGFVNIKLFRHSLHVVRGRYTPKDAPGEVSHFQALSSAVSATVGLGNIAGVSVAVVVGGPGAVIWMMVAGVFGMTMKFVEVMMGQKYRDIDEDGKVSGGACQYLTKGLEKRGMGGLGKVMAAAFAVFCIGASLASGNMFQANQAVSALTTNFSFLNGTDMVLSFLLALGVGVVLLGGIKRIACVAEMIVPFMAVLYVISALVVIIVNIEHLGEAVRVMFSSAFGGEQVMGGVLGAIIAGIKRATFSNEAGIGSAPIAHAAARTKEPVSEGCVALLEPFIDTIVICFMTGLVITISGVYTQACGLHAADVTQCIEAGSPLASAAFGTVSHWFTYTLSISILLFAFSTMMTWSYYGERSWAYLFGKGTTRIYIVIFCMMTFLGGITNIGVVIDFSDLLLFCMAIPNLIGLYIMHREIKEDVVDYMRRLKAGELKTYK